MGNNNSSTTPDQCDSTASPRRTSLSSCLERPIQISFDSEDDNLQIPKAQLIMVNKCWTAARTAGSDEPGRSILVAMISKCPEIEEFFNRMDEDRRNSGPSASPGSSPGSRRIDKRGSHCYQKTFSIIAWNITTSLDQILASLLKREPVKDRLIKLGEKHASYWKFGFKLEYFTVFSECTIQKSLVWGNRYQRNSATFDAWSKLIYFVVSKMRKGYEQGILNSRTSTPDTPLCDPDNMRRRVSSVSHLRVPEDPAAFKRRVYHSVKVKKRSPHHSPHLRNTQ